MSLRFSSNSLRAFDYNVWELIEDSAPAKPLIENPTDGSLLVLVPEGKFIGGVIPIEAELPAYYIGIHPVTNIQYKCFVESTGHRTPKKSRKW